MRSLSLVVCCGLLVACSGGDEDPGNGGGAGSTGTAGHAAQGGATGNGAAGTNSSNAGTSTSNGGRRSDGGNGGRAGATGTAGSSSSTAGSSTGGSSTAGNDPYGDARTRCVNRTNELRATKGLPPIPRLASAEACADGQAKSDSESGKAHGAFNACADQVKGWKGIAQNECPNYGSVEDTLTKCLDAMWAEGPGGGHYDNMTGGSTDTACGIYKTPAGKVWLVQDFWTK